jgi:hypothetical protein
MANPFKQAELAKKTAPGSKKVEQKVEEKVEPIVVEETPKAEEKVEVKPVEVKETKKTEQKKTVKKEKEAKEVKETNELFAGLKAEKKERGVGVSIYLPVGVLEKVKKNADELGTSPSKLIAHILNEVL